MRALSPERVVSQVDPEPGDCAHLTAAFVDPEEFHFRTFEYIVPLDRFFADIKPRVRLNKPLPLLDDDRAWMLQAKLDKPLRERLLALDRADLYLPPLNAGSRGGKRLIFHCAMLAKFLTRAVRKILPRGLAKTFSHVNPVFRCNRFSPEDASFHSHHDTPYSDSARHHISRYTLLLYMTGGEAAPVLRLGDLALDEIAPWTCVIFAQNIEHEGHVFDEGDKIFLRTELVFEEHDLRHDPHIAKLFSQACALTGESLANEHVAKHVHQAYDRVARAHFSGLERSSLEEVYLHKQFGPIHFMSNGHDYWFSDAQLSLQACASLVVLDYFNAKIANTSFRKLCQSNTLTAHTDQRWISDWLKGHPTLSDIDLITHFDIAHLFPDPPQVEEGLEFPDRLYELNDGIIRGFNDSDDYMRCEAVEKAYKAAASKAKQLLTGAPILIMGETVWLDERQYVVHGNQILIGSQTPFEPINFAAFTSYSHDPEDYIDTKITIDAPHLLLPPILFERRTEGVWHLMCDFFQNSWMTSYKKNTVDVPEFRWPW